MDATFLYKIFLLILGLITFIPMILALLSFALFKKKKSKEDFLYMQKSTMQTILLFSFLIIFILSRVSATEINEHLVKVHVKVQEFIFAICILSIGFIDLRINYEKYMKYYDPTFVINDFISQRVNNITYELFYIGISLICSFISFNYLNIDGQIEVDPIISSEINLKNLILKKNPLILNKSVIFNSYFENVKNNYNDLNLNFFYSQFENYTISNSNFSLFFPNTINNFLQNKTFNQSIELFENIVTQNYLISSLVLVYPILIILIIGCLVLKLKKLKIMKSISQDYKYNCFIEKEIKIKLKVEQFEIVFIILKFFCNLIIIFLIYFIYEFRLKNQVSEFENKFSYYLETLSIFYLLIVFFEYIFLMFYISRTDFYRFTLGNTSFSKFYKIFLPEVVEKPTISIESSFNNFNSHNYFKERSKELNSTCLFFHNNLSYCIDEIFVNIFDNTINIVIAALTKLIRNKKNHNLNDNNRKFSNLNNHQSKKPFRSCKNVIRENSSENNNLKNFNKNVYIYEEEQDPRLEKKQTNSKSFDENFNGNKNANMNLTFNLEDTNFKESFIDNNDKLKFENNLNIKSNKRAYTSISSLNYMNFHEFEISDNHDDFDDEKLLRLININAEKDCLMNQEKFSNRPIYGCQDENIDVQINQENKIQRENKINSINSKRSYYNLLKGLNLHLKIKEYYQKDFQEIMNIKQLTLMSLENSFMSHYNEIQNNFLSLFSNNAKEELFKKQENLVIRTNDKLFNFEFLTDDYDNLNENDFENGNLKRYISYIKENESTFLPCIVGVFKIKINNLKELKLVITKNTLIDEVPKEHYNYWQLVRIKEENCFQMITSSKDRLSLLVSDEILIKSDSKFNLINFNDFGKILFSDLELLRTINSAKYSLLLMYYELGKNNAHNSQNSISEDDIKIFREKYGRISCYSNNGMNNTNNNISVIRPFGEPSAIDVSLKNDLNFINIRNGFQSTANEFKCILFFMFENIFKKQKFFDKFSMCSNKHEKFELMARNKFVELKY